jgi:hypothetical protein
MTDIYDENHPNLAMTIGGIGNVLKRQGHLDEALVEYRKAHQLLVAGLGPDHPDVASSHNNVSASADARMHY